MLSNLTVVTTPEGIVRMGSVVLTPGAIVRVDGGNSLNVKKVGWKTELVYTRSNGVSCPPQDISSPGTHVVVTRRKSDGPLTSQPANAPKITGGRLQQRYS